MKVTIEFTKEEIETIGKDTAYFIDEEISIGEYEDLDFNNDQFVKSCMNEALQNNIEEYKIRTDLLNEEIYNAIIQSVKTHLMQNVLNIAENLKKTWQMD